MRYQIKKYITAMIYRNIQIDEVLSALHVSKADLAKVLFPDNEHPVRSLKRLSTGKTKITLEQVFIIADYLGLTLDELLSDQWVALSKPANYLPNQLLFKRGRFNAILDLRYMTSRLFYDGVFLKDMIIHKRSIKVSEYLMDLKEWSEEHEKSLNIK